MSLRRVIGVFAIPTCKDSQRLFRGDGRKESAAA
jgi:hypothetical protein